MLLAVLLACTYTLVFFFAKLGLHAPPPPAIVPPEDPPHATTTLPPPPTRAPPSTPPPRTAATATKPRAAPHALPKWSGRPTTCHHHPPAAASPIAALHATAQSRVPAPPTTTTPPSKSNGSPKTVRDDGGSTVGLRFLGSGGSLWSGGQICITCQKRKNRRRECRFICVRFGIRPEPRRPTRDRDGGGGPGENRCQNETKLTHAQNDGRDQG